MSNNYFKTFTRNEYDKVFFDMEVKQSENVGNYILSDYYSHPQKSVCFQPGVELYGQDQQLDISKTNNMVNIESELQNINRKFSKDPKKQFPFVKSNTNNPKLATCNQNLITKYSRLEGPTFKRGVAFGDVNFDVPIMNPQLLSRIHSNTYVGENTYLTEVDSYKIKTETPLDVTTSLPSNEQLNTEKYAKKF
jgi:hypothetical protein